MKALVIVLALGSILFAACANSSKNTSTPTSTSTPTEVATPTIPVPGTVRTPSVPCYTPANDQKSAIIAALSKIGGRLEKETFVLYVDGDCIRGTKDWSMANSFVKDHPDASPTEVSPTPNQQVADWERSVGLPFGSVDRDVFWVSATGPSTEVCAKLNLKCAD